MSGLSSGGSSSNDEPPNLYLSALYVVLRDLCLARAPDREPSEAGLRQMLQETLERVRTEWREECATVASTRRRGL